MPTGSDVVALAQRELGKPYVFGADGPEAFDCSGLVQWVYAQLGISLPHRATLQRQKTIPVTTPLPGDLVFYGTEAYSHHVAIYAGNGRMIAAPQPGENVKLQDVYGTPTYGRIPGLGTSLVAAPAEWLGGLLPGPSDAIAAARPIVITALFVGAGIALVLIGGGQLAGARQHATATLRKVFPA
jgi:NlpC/P60 family